MNFLHNRALIVIGAALALGIGGGIAIADIPSSTDGTITACMVKPGGTIRLIDAEAGATCKKGEAKVEWNAEGQPGQDGVSGYESVERETIVQFDGPQGGVVVQGACPTGKAVMATSVVAFYENADNSFAGGVRQGYSLLRDTDSDGIRDAIDYQFFRDNGVAFEDGKHFRGIIRLNCIDVTS
jgi:hypothetical protein